ncbi:DnaJ like chaperone protein [Rhodobium gokarnense]|uniref:DnaJ like chaperone protein n=2 Tax=Rhodobium gokarnense TaxID=364296 RepID=A0ABT3H9H8_9HYPH|nr:molecular chaperone DjiA [Rhodobium gokarnense]MCW2307052.1 DnaJ like chaperone protein [Rhodobium gokarnense]
MSGGQRLIDAVYGMMSSGGSARRQVAFTVAMIALTAKMAKADGVVTEDEISAFSELFDIPAGEEKNVARLFNLAKQDVSGYEYYARRIAGMFADEPQALEDILDGLFHIAKADHVLHEGELAYLKRVSELFGFDAHHFGCIKARHVHPEASDPYIILDIDRSASEEELRRHYRRLVNETHPDRLIARGVPEEFVTIANDRLAAVNDAWTRIRQERGIR